jgi:hypothetical protein
MLNFNTWSTNKVSNRWMWKRWYRKGHLWTPFIYPVYISKRCLICGTVKQQSTNRLFIPKPLTMMNIENLYDYVLHFNPYNNTWNAIPRDKYNEYWSNHKGVDGVISSSKFETLIELITKGDDFIKSIS